VIKISHRRSRPSRYLIRRILSLLRFSSENEGSYTAENSNTSAGVEDAHRRQRRGGDDNQNDDSYRWKSEDQETKGLRTLRMRTGTKRRQADYNKCGSSGNYTARKGCGRPYYQNAGGLGRHGSQIYNCRSAIYHALYPMDVKG
jgi:hypothetical protein